MYTYKAIIKRVYDGDTLYADVDLGFGFWIHDMALRLARVNTPELRGDEREAGLIAKAWVVENVVGQEVTIKTEKTGKYGRYIAEIILPDNINLSDELLKLGLAIPY